MAKHKGKSKGKGGKVGAAGTPPPPKKPGSKDKVPGQRKIKASIRSIIEEVVENESRTVRQAVVGGIKGGPKVAHHYLKLAAEYLDGKPDQGMTLKFDLDEVADAKKSLNDKLDILLKRIAPDDALSEPPTS